MRKATKTAAELEAMILNKMQTLSECPHGMTVTVKRHGETWEALTMPPNQVAYADCAARVALYAAVLRTEYALSDSLRTWTYASFMPSAETIMSDSCSAVLNSLAIDHPLANSRGYGFDLALTLRFSPVQMRLAGSKDLLFQN